MNSPLRVGVVGVGWGAAVQVPAFRAGPGYEVVSLCARRPERAAAAAEQLGVADSASDWTTFVTRDDIDVVSVCAPVALHRSIAVAALEAGKHVLCEKPMALHAGDAGAMAAAASSSGLGNAVCFQNRWSNEKHRVHEIVSEGRLGQVYLCQISAVADYWHPTRRAQAEWMYHQADGGGYLAGLAAHDIDYVCWLFGPPEAVCADVRTSVPLRSRRDGSQLVVDADDTSALLLRMRSGPLVVLTTSAVALHAKDSYRFDAFGSLGAVAIEGSFFGGEVRFGGTDDADMHEVPGSDLEVPRPDDIPNKKSATPIRALALLLENWLPTLHGGPASDVPTFDDGLLVQRIIDAARTSASGKGWIALD
jgi:predicted dehydrogenase